jgi:hypothetical protein
MWIMSKCRLFDNEGMLQGRKAYSLAYAFIGFHFMAMPFGMAASRKLCK